MENIKRNSKAINDVYKNAHMALQSISNIITTDIDKELKKELQEEYEGYEKIIGEISSFMTKNNYVKQDVNAIKKTMLKVSIKTKLFFNKSKNKITEMMILGTVMGIIELTAMLNEKETLNKDVVSYIETLLGLEEGYEQKLKQYL
ncbi:MAG: hypothetical protein IJR66_00915 [Clostridia bacterium]|nr:hypothetical protein [Clostridia bacterium]